ncbi:MAG TPA: glycosyltransferase family 4 protein [Kiritimatiellia bacterium]|mgnify:CR=1 FL=1|nr:glycosyltransferase family 4 protein [Kiritimatiellia bacterium]HMO98687.1 glycosyltransferase family 4 protein [Kiritimatiellia bacterium]
MPLSIRAYVHHPDIYTRRSGMYPLAEAMGAETVFYTSRWEQAQHVSWRLGQVVRRFSQSWYGSEWSYLFPVWDEWRMARAGRAPVDVDHFLFGEFAYPRHPAWFRKKARLLAGTFHASSRRLPRVLGGYRGFRSFDVITLMSASQKPYFLEQGFPAESLFVTRHGVDTSYFRPDPERPASGEGPLRGLLVGSTERDHAFMAAVLRALPPGVLQMTILTSADQRSLHYQDVPYADFPRHLPDAGLLAAYQKADLLIMPMLDCTANNAILEAMACGTPVMTNPVGGIREYVDPGCNFILPDQDVDAWVDQLLALARERDALRARRPSVRAWAETFDWNLRAREFVDVFEQALAVRS